MHTLTHFSKEFQRLLIKMTLTFVCNGFRSSRPAKSLRDAEAQIMKIDPTQQDIRQVIVSEDATGTILAVWDVLGGVYTNLYRRFNV